MKVLAISCADQLLSVSLNINGEIKTEETASNRDHNKFILVFINSLLAKAEISLGEIDAVAYGRGPGSYTGLRIAAGVAQGIAYGADKPVVPVSSMAAIAQKVSGNRVFVALDAKRNKLFVGLFEKNSDGIAEPVGEETLTAIEDVQLSGESWIGAGDGWDLRSERLEQAFDKQLDCWLPNHQSHSEEISVLGMEYFKRGLAVDSQLAIPKYLSPYFSN